MNSLHRLFLVLAVSRAWIAFGSDISIHVAEGIYDVQLVCEDRSNPNCGELNRKARLAVIQTEDAILAGVGYPEQSLSRYTFISHTLDLQGGRYYGTPSLKNTNASAPLSEALFEFIWNGEHLEVQGVIRDARFLKDIQLKGIQILPSQKLNPPESVMNAGDANPVEEGRFVAKGTHRQWLVTIRHALAVSEQKRFLIEATDLGNPEKNEFASGDRLYLSSTLSSRPGTIEFLAPLTQPGGFLKWVLWSTPEDILRLQKLNGFFFSSNGVFSPLTIERLK